MMKATNLKPWEKDKHPLGYIFSDDEQTELSIRSVVRQCYRDTMTGKGSMEDVELERVLFDVIYPLFGRRQVKDEVY